MIYKWNELNFENFFEILNGYRNRESWSLGKLLEIQHISPPINSDVKGNLRIFFDNGNLDGIEWVKNYFGNSIITALEDLVGELKNKCSVVLLNDGEPSIIPLFDMKEEHIFNLLFRDPDSPITCSYTRDNSGKPVPYDGSSRSKLSDKKRLVRCRSVDIEDWNRVINEDRGKLPEEWTKDDLVI